MRLRHRLQMALLAIPVALAIAAPFAVAQSGTTYPVGDSAEAWYASTPGVGCSSPIGCLPVAPANVENYPPNTLHVGALGGQEAARSYLEPDFSSLPPGATLLSGTMIVPIDTASGSGNESISAATIVACLVTQEFSDGESGSTQSPPSADCTNAIPAAYESANSTFTINLGHYLSDWNNGAPELGIALEPAPNESPSQTWEVTFNGRDLAGAPHAMTTFTIAAPGTTTFGGTIISSPVSGSTQVPGVTPIPAPSAPATQSSSPSGPPLAAASPPSSATARSTAANGFQYPEILLLPLALLVGLVYSARVLTADATPRRLLRVSRPYAAPRPPRPGGDVDPGHLT